MKMPGRIIIVTGLILSLLLQTGCWDQKLYEDIGFILQCGLETGEDGKLLFSMTSPVVATDAKDKVEFLNTSKESLVRTSRERLRNSSGKLLQGGKIQMVYFSRELAEKGINGFLEVFLRDTENPLLSNVVVVNKSPKEMIEFSLNFKDKPRPGQYVTDLLQDARRRLAVPETRIYNFSILQYSKTIDPATPLMIYSKDTIEVVGSALFSGDRMVGDIDTHQTALLNILMGNDRSFEYTFKLDSLSTSENKIKQGATITLKSSKPKIKIDVSGNVPHITINLKIKASVTEFAGEHSLDDSEEKHKLEVKIANLLKLDVDALLKYLQQVGSDPIGFGEKMRVKDNAYWKSIKWKDVYGKAVFDTKVRINLEKYGAIT